MLDGASAAPRTRMETAVAGIWQELLGVAQVGTEQDFFELGGESLTAVRMLAAVEELLLAQVSFADFLDSPTVSGLTAAIEASRREAPASTLVAPAAASASASASASATSPCSFAQERLWFVDRLDGSNGAYNEVRGARIRGALDAAALERALVAVASRHDALRTVFSDIDGVPVQVVSPEPEIGLDRHSVRGEQEAEDALQALAQTLATEPFDLERGPLIRAHLIEVGDADHVLQLVIHHAVSDGWSHVVLLRELGELYAGFARGEVAHLAAPRAQYPEHARRQRAQLSGEALEAAVAPWVQRLAGAPATHSLPTDRPRLATPSYRGAAHVVAVPAPSASAARAFARETRTTTFATMLAAYYVLLHRHSDAGDLVVGATTSGRGRSELEDAVGLFASTVALRCDLSDAPSFRELVARVRDVVMWAMAHDEAPFDQVVAKLGLTRDLSRHPVFQVFCAHVAEVPMPVAGAEPYQARPAASRFDLTLFVEEQPHEGLRLAWEYSSDLFDASTIERFCEQYLVILGAVLASPDVSIAALALPGPDGRVPTPAGAPARAAAPATPGATEYPVACMHELFEARVSERPEAVALVFGDESLTYAELNTAANRLAHRLRRLGAGPETPVGLFLEPSVELVTAILGVLKAGAAYVPLDPEYPADRTEFVLADTGAPLLLTVSGLLERLPDHRARTVCLDDFTEAPDGDAENHPEPLAGPENLAYVIYTSGSTGRPKGVAVEHRQVARLFFATDAWYGFGPEDVWVLLHSYAFDFSVWELWGALAYGGRLVISPLWTTRSPQALATLIADEAVTVMNATPSLFVVVQEELLRTAERLALRFVVFGGEALQPAALRPWFERFGDGGARLVNMYGITETTVHVTYRPIAASDCKRESSPIGVSIPDLTLHLLDPAGVPVSDGVAGELYVGGAGVARGYLNRPELTAERFIENPFGPGRLYRTGDVARRLPDGEFDFRGRIDDQVKVRGFRIELGEVQAAIRDLPGIADCAVVGVDVAPGDTRLAAYVVPADPSAAGVPEAVTAQLEQRLPLYMVPGSVSVLERLPLTRNGKTDRNALPPPIWETRAAERSAPPRTPTEQLIAQIWASVLDVEMPGREDDFFNLGGHSLLAARVGTQVRRHYAVDLSVRVLFEQPTLAAFAAHVDSLISAQTGEPPDGDSAASCPANAPDSVPPASGLSPRSAEDWTTSAQQAALLFFDTLDPGSSIYNAPLAIRVAGELDVAALRSALTCLVQRHESLRTVFVRQEDELARQVVLEQWELEFTEVDLSAFMPAQREPELQRLMREHAARAFDLERDVMLRATVFRLGPLGHVILLASHHIVLDAWAVEILYRELGECYEATRRRRPVQLPELAMQYRDFARWQRARLSGPQLERELDFWRSELAGAPAMLELPIDTRRPPEQSYAGATHRWRLPAELAERVRAVGQARQVTPYMLLLGTFATLLYRRSGQDDIVVGGPMANREHSALEHMIGFCANTIVVRVRLGGNPRFSELLDRVRDSVLGSYEHQEAPLELVVDAVRPQRIPGVNPLFQVNFRVRVGAPPVPQLTGARTSLVPIDLGHARFDLALELHVGDEALKAELNYNTALFQAASIERLAVDLEGLLGQVLAEPEKRLLSFELSTDQDGTASTGPSEPDGVVAGAGIRGFRRAGSS